MTSLHAVISGLVQGVGFRYFAAQTASRLDISGFTRNLITGEVEVHATGERERLEEFLVALRRGPRASMVRDVRVQWDEASHAGYVGFEIR
ncbi:MAG: acylphosphatase [Ignavibacteriae bacterium]|nr:acylphosphatase [Ignavibacteriota bacterium]